MPSHNLREFSLPSLTISKYWQLTWTIDLWGKGEECSTEVSCSAQTVIFIKFSHIPYTCQSCPVLAKNYASLWKVEETFNSFLFNNLRQGLKISTKKLKAELLSIFKTLWIFILHFHYGSCPPQRKRQLFKMLSMLYLVKCFSTPIWFASL